MSELFPELDDHVDIEPAPRPASSRGRDDAEHEVHHEHDVRIARPGLAAGIESVARFERAFGLPGAIRSLKKTAGDEIELIIALADGQLAAASLVPLGARAWKQGKSFGVAFRGASIPALVGKAQLRFLARYDGVPFETILAQVVPDPGDEHMLHNDYPESVFYAFAPGSGWRRFFEGTELYRGTCELHTGKVVTLEHTDIECAFNVVPPDNRVPGFFNAPRLDRDPYSTESPSRHMLTDIQDRDVILGADKLLDQALESLADDPNKPEMVFVPFGVDGAARWLRAVGQALGRSDEVEQVLAAELAAITPSWRVLTARARRRRVGFVIEHPDWRAALAPSRSLGVPTLAMLREMGFGIDVLAFNGSSSLDGDVRVESFRSCAELEARLRAAEASLWYSELLYERRLTRLRQFRMGVRGALDTLAELVRLAELPFYRRYHHYLGPAFVED